MAKPMTTSPRPKANPKRDDGMKTSPRPKANPKNEKQKPTPGGKPKSYMI